MDLKDKLISSFMAFENNVDVDHPVHEVRMEAMKNFEIKGFPSKKEEAWKYTSLNSLQKVDFSIFPKELNALEYKEVKKYFINEIDTYKIVFIDGIFSSNLSETTHDGVDICLMSSALNKPMYKQIIDVYFNKVASKDESLTTLNTALVKKGRTYIFLRIKCRRSPLRLCILQPVMKLL
jgi:Fe-S cluster assembly protein SufD